jgi:hypothetical protein
MWNREGWVRLGIVLSGLYLIAAAFLSWQFSTRLYKKVFDYNLKGCEERKLTPYCFDQATSIANNEANVWVHIVGSMLSATILLFLIWFIILVLIRIIGWVVAGFKT